MGIITGKEFMDRLDQMENDIWLDGEKIKGKISEHPAFKGIIKSKASLYDLQHHPELKEQMIYILPEDGQWTGLSFLQPKMKDDLKRKRKMMEHWARMNHGLMGRSPDYMKTGVMSLAASSSY